MTFQEKTSFVVGTSSKFITEYEHQNVLRLDLFAGVKEKGNREGGNVGIQFFHVNTTILPEFL